jgi:hypothetical protein
MGEAARCLGGLGRLWSLRGRTAHGVPYDAQAAALKTYGLYTDEQGRDVLTAGTIVYNFAHKTYTITSSHGDYKETTTGSYTDSQDTAKTQIYQNGELFMTREVKTHRL